jgi:hypothetical protein
VLTIIVAVFARGWNFFGERFVVSEFQINAQHTVPLSINAISINKIKGYLPSVVVDDWAWQT